MNRPTGSPAAPRRTVIASLAALCLIFTVLAVARTRATEATVDDSYIFYRYAQHLATGEGLVWNPGEPPVEGFTSLLWVVVLAGMRALGADLVLAAQALGLASSLGVLLLTWALARRCNPGRAWPALAAAALVGLCPPTLMWATSGMEGPFYTLLLLLCTLLWLRTGEQRVPGWLLGGLLLLLCLARPEGLLVALFLGAVELAPRLVRRGSRTRSASCLWQAGAVLAAGLALLLAWRWVYFGSLLPNTYFAKTGGGMFQLLGGLRYALFWWDLWLPGVLAGLAILASRRAPTCRRLALGLLLLTTAAVVLEGGDHFGMGRFLLPALPFCAVLVVSVIADLEPSLPQRPFRLLAACGALLLVVGWVGDRRYEGAYRDAFAGLVGGGPTWSLVELPEADPGSFQIMPRVVAGFSVMARTLERAAGPDRSIALVPVGTIGYLTGMRVVDMVGIVDPVIARQPGDPRYMQTWRPGHDKGDGARVLDLEPDFIQLQDVLTSRPAPTPIPEMMSYKSVAEIWASPRFWRDYEFIALRTEGGWYYNLYRRRAGSTGD